MGSQPLLFALSGAIGVGKSTLLNKIATKYHRDKVYVYSGIQEDHWTTIWNSVKEDKHDLLELLYSEFDFTFKFQSYAQIELVKKTKNVLENAKLYGSKIAITERSCIEAFHVFTNLAKELEKISQCEYAILLAQYKALQNIYASAFNYTGIFYLKIDAAHLKQRIQTRNRCQERNINLKYLKHLVKKYDELCDDSVKHFGQTIIVNANDTPENIENIVCATLDNLLI